MAKVKVFKTLTFEDTPAGRKKMDKELSEWTKLGWKVKSKETSQQGYDAGKTCCLGCIFLPLALLGKKKNQITVHLEAEEDKKRS